MHMSRVLYQSASKPGQRLLARTLYRSLLRTMTKWGNQVPLASFVAPVTLHPPQVDAEALAKFSALGDLQLMGIKSDEIPSNSHFSADKMTLPIYRASDANLLFRLVFKLNKEEAETPEIQKERISWALGALKSMNELSPAIQKMKEERQDHFDRSKVRFLIGQVVQHKAERWRGVVIGWEKFVGSQPSSSKTSLTTKDYMPLSGEEVSIKYTLLKDTGDVRLFGDSTPTLTDVTGSTEVIQTSLEIVKESLLSRIRHPSIGQVFNGFDLSEKRFIPNENLVFCYPSDTSQAALSSGIDRKVDDLARTIISGVQKMAKRLEDRLADNENSSNSALVSTYREQLATLKSGLVESLDDKYSEYDLSNVDRACLHLRKLLNVHLEISELLEQRSVADEFSGSIKFRPGDIVLHKKYDFRGVVVAWDRYPVVDVSFWDGLQEIENPERLPFYSIVPDQGDCVKAFGGERPFRYCCEANLVACPSKDAAGISVDLDTGWELASDKQRYEPPDDVLFKFGEHPYRDDENTRRLLEQVQQDMVTLNLFQRGESEGADFAGTEEIVSALSLDNLFRFLELADSMENANVIEDTIKEIWKANKDQERRRDLEQGTSDLMRGNKSEALRKFEKLVEEEPIYAEAWNKLSTAYFMLDELEKSIHAANQTLELNPRHFQAWGGKGLILFERKRYEEAENCQRRCLELNPWSPIASRLVSCIDMRRKHLE